MSHQTGPVLWELSKAERSFRKPPSPGELVDALQDRIHRDPQMNGQDLMRLIGNATSIKTWIERCEIHPDHQMGMVTHGMIAARMQEEIDDLRGAINELVKIVKRQELRNVREFSHEAGKFV